MQRNIRKNMAKLLIACMAFTTVGAFADLPAREADATAAEAQKKVEEIQEQRDDVKQEINSLDTQLVSVLTSIETLEGDIAETEQEIADTEVELEAAQASVEKQYSDMKTRIKYMYERGDENFLEMLLESGSISDFLNRSEYITSVYDYDRELLNAYTATQREIADMKVVLESDKINLEKQKDELSVKKSSLDSLIATKKTELKDFDKQLEAAKAEAARRAAEERERARLAEIKRQQEEARRAAAAAEAARQRQQQQQQGSGSGSGSSGSSGSGSGKGSASNADSVSGGGRNPSGTTGVSGSDVVAYAKQFVGNPYVWGGNSLTDGCDCSGFVVQVYKHFGINLSGSRYSGALQSVGQAVDYECIQPGDIVCYAGHVGIYAGGGVIVEAQSSKAGITCSRAVTCKKILAIRRVI